MLLYLPALGNFFSADDWFHLRISQIESLGQFFNFFSFSLNDQSASFYRPLSTQVFFFISQTLFGLNAFWYYFFGLTLFGYSVYLVKKFSDSTLAAFIYAISVSNFTRIYFISAFQELFLVVFSLLTLLNFKTRPKLSLLFFVLALLSKETAIVVPALLLIFNYQHIVKSKFLNLRSEILISVIYLYLRLFQFGLAAGDSYIWDFSPLKAINTLMWYTLWSFGAPELLIDYIGSGLKLVPKFFTDYADWWRVIIYPLIALIGLSLVLLFKKLNKLNVDLFKFSLFYLICLLPVLFLPSHKFTLELGLPLVGFAIALAILIKKSNHIFYFLLLSLFIFYNLSMNYLTYTRHYSVSRGEVSEKVYNHFVENYPKEPVEHYFEFVNDTEDYGSFWGQSKQVSHALSESEFFKVFYNNKNYTVYYEDINTSRPILSSPIFLSTKMFLEK